MSWFNKWAGSFLQDIKDASLALKKSTQHSLCCFWPAGGKPCGRKTCRAFLLRKDKWLIDLSLPFRRIEGASSPPAVPVNCKGFQATVLGSGMLGWIKCCWIFWKVENMSCRFTQVYNRYIGLYDTYTNSDSQHVPPKSIRFGSPLPALLCGWCFKLIPNWRCLGPLLQTRPWALHCWTNRTVAFVMAWAMQSTWVKTKSCSHDSELMRKHVL